MTVQIHGKEYVTCAERLQLVKESGKSFEVIESAPLQVGDRWLWRCVVKVDERTFVANAEVKLSNARKGSPDESNPMECGETSALARCLGFAGFGVIESVASYDEIARSQPTEAREAATPARQEPAQSTDVAEGIRVKIDGLMGEFALLFPTMAKKPDWRILLAQRVWGEVPQTYTVEHYRALNAYYIEQKSGKQPAKKAS